MFGLSKSILHFSCVNSVSAGVWNYVKMSSLLSHAAATAAAAPWAVVQSGKSENPQIRLSLSVIINYGYKVGQL